MPIDDVAHWCPNCGTEYRPGFTQCADCHVALVDQPPPPQPAVDHELVTYDLNGWSREGLTALEMRLNAEGIVHTLALDELTVGKAAEVIVDEILEAVEDATVDEGPRDRRSDDDDEADGSGGDETFDDEGPTDEGLGDPATGATFDGQPPIGAELDTLTHECRVAGCPDAVLLRYSSPAELVVSWVRRDGDRERFVTLRDVLDAHTSDELAAVVEEHIGCLIEVAAMLNSAAERWRRPDVEFGADDDIGFGVTIGDVADFAAELSSWCLPRFDAGTATDLDTRAATAVLRAMTAISATSAILDAAREHLLPAD